MKFFMKYYALNWGLAFDIILIHLFEIKKSSLGCLSAGRLFDRNFASVCDMLSLEMASLVYLKPGLPDNIHPHLKEIQRS